MFHLVSLSKIPSNAFNDVPPTVSGPKNVARPVYLTKNARHKYAEFIMQVGKKHQTQLLRHSESSWENEESAPPGAACWRQNNHLMDQFILRKNRTMVNKKYKSKQGTKYSRKVLIIKTWIFSVPEYLGKGFFFHFRLKFY